MPAVHEELCSRRLMVMEEVYPSVPLHDALDAQAAKLALQRGVTKEQVAYGARAHAAAGPHLPASHHLLSSALFAAVPSEREGTRGAGGGGGSQAAEAGASAIE